MNTIYQGFKLYAQPSFWEGVGRLLDVSGSMNEYNYSSSTKEADYKAMQSDWECVGLDIFDGIKRFEQENNGRITQ